MHNKNIIPITDQKVPTIVSFSKDSNAHVIGDEARLTGLKGKTTVFNFKPVLGKGDAEFSKDKKFWCFLPPSEKQKETITTYTAKEATLNFLKELLRDREIPEQVLIGEPAIRDDTWKNNFRRHIREIFKEMDVNTEPLFFPEPFAVFQYYRNQYLKKSFSSETVLIIDIGGGTFNSCIIKTTDDGYLSRGGGTNIPLGLQAKICGGSVIDRELLHKVVTKAKEDGIEWKDNPMDRAEKDGSPVLLKIEDAKIQISDQIGPSAKLAGDYSHIETQLFFVKGELHPEKDIDVKLSAEDLKFVIRKLWRKDYGHIILETINEAKKKLENLKYKFEKLDKVIVAGGSSKLPFMKEEIKTVIPTMIDEEHISIAPYLGRAVAYGLAFEGLEQISRNPNLSVDKIVPCLLNELYIGFKKDRRSEVIIPKIKYEGKTFNNGQLISEPFVIEEYVLKYEFELPFEINGKLFYYFSDRPIQDTEFTPLNAGNDVISINTQNKIARKWELEIHINKNSVIKPSVIYKEKGKGAKRGGTKINLAEFQFQNFNLKEGKSFIGIDFGTTNSYVVQFIKPQDAPHDTKYPHFEINPNTLDKVRELESALIALKSNDVFNEEKIIEYSKNQILKLVFHSNKIEGNPLTQGETEKVLQKSTASGLSNQEREAYNLQNAYNWMIENKAAWQEEPEGYLRSLNKMILEGIDKGNGEYRKKSVKISGVEFKPPIGSSVPSFMEQLSGELKKGCEDRSVVEFATSMHTKFVSIHPFVDGNGRTARLLVNAILLSNHLPPIIVNFADKQRYLYGLTGSNNGDLSNLLDFFVECFYESLENYKSWIEISEKSELFEIQDDTACKAEEINTTVNPIQEALIEVGADIATDPIALAMEPKIEKYQKLMEADYESWKNSFLLLKSELFSIIEKFNSNDQYQASGFKMRFFEYDMLSFDKYLDLCKDKKVTKTWFMAYEIQSFYKSERLLFFFVNNSKRPANKSFNPISLILARAENSQYRKLESEPIQLREVGYSNGQLIFLLSDGEIVEGHVKLTIEKMIANVITSYF